MDRADAVYSVSNTPNGKVEMGINQVSSVGGAHLSPETDNTYHRSRGAKSRVPQREREKTESLTVQLGQMKVWNHCFQQVS